MLNKIAKKEKTKAIGFLAELFGRVSISAAEEQRQQTSIKASASPAAENEAVSETNREVVDLSEHIEEINPQACVLLIKTNGSKELQRVGGMVSNATSFHHNPEAEDVIQNAHKALDESRHLGGKFKIVGIAMTADQDNFDLSTYMQSLAKLPNLTATKILLVDIDTGESIETECFRDRLQDLQGSMEYGVA